MVRTNEVKPRTRIRKVFVASGKEMNVQRKNHSLKKKFEMAEQEKK